MLRSIFDFLRRTLRRRYHLRKMREFNTTEAVFYSDMNDRIRLMSDDEFLRYLKSYSPSRRRKTVER